MAATIPVATATPEAAIAQREQRERANAPANAAAGAVAGPIPGHAVRVLDPRTEYSFVDQRVTKADVEAVARQFERLTLVDVSGATLDGRPCTDPVVIHRLFPHHPRLTVKGALGNTVTQIASKMSAVDAAKYIGLMAAFENAVATHFTDLNKVGSVQAMTELWVDHAGEALQAFLRALPYFIEIVRIQSKYPDLGIAIDPSVAGDLSVEAVRKLKSSLRNERADIEEALDYALANIDMQPIMDALQKIVVGAVVVTYKPTMSELIQFGQIVAQNTQPIANAIRQHAKQIIKTILDVYVQNEATTLLQAVEIAFQKVGQLRV